MLTFILFIAVIGLGLYSMKMTHKYTDKKVPLGYELFGDKKNQKVNSVLSDTSPADIDSIDAQRKLHEMTKTINAEEDYNVDGEGGMFVIAQTKDEKFFWEFRSNNNRAMATSSEFKTKKSVKNNLLSFLGYLRKSDFAIRFRIPEK